MRCMDIVAYLIDEFSYFENNVKLLLIISKYGIIIIIGNNEVKKYEKYK